MSMPPGRVPSNPDNDADRLIQMYDEMQKIRGGLQKGLNDVTANRTGVDENPDAWDDVAFQHSRLQVLLCSAVGIPSGIPDYELSAENMEKANGIALDPPLVQARIGELMEGSLSNTISWNTFTGSRDPIDGRAVWELSPNPNFPGTRRLMAKRLDQHTAQVIKQLEQQNAGLNKNDPAYIARENKIYQLKQLRFQKFIQTVDEEVNRVDADWDRRRGLDPVVGAIATNRHNEQNPDTMLLLGGLAAKLGVRVGTLSEIVGFDSRYMTIVEECSIDPKTGKTTGTIHFGGISLLSSRSMQRSAGIFIATAMRFAREPELEPEIEIEMVPDPKNPMKMIPKLDPTTKQEIPVIDPATGKPKPQRDKDGNVIPKKDKDGNVIFIKDENGHIKYKPLEGAKRAEFFSKFTIPAGSPYRSVSLLMDMIVLHHAMGQSPPMLFGFNPNAKPPDENYFDAAQVRASLGQMSPMQQDAVMKRITANPRGFFAEAVLRHQEYTLKPKLYEAAQADPKFALERICAADPSQDPRTDKSKPFTDKDVEAYVARNPKINAKKIADMKKRPLDKNSLGSKEKNMALARHAALKAADPAAAERIERELTESSFKDTSRGHKGPRKEEAEIHDDKSKSSLETDVITVTAEDEDDPAISTALDDADSLDLDTPDDPFDDSTGPDDKFFGEANDEPTPAEIQIVIDRLVNKDSMNTTQIKNLLAKLGNEKIKEIALEVRKAESSTGNLHMIEADGKVRVSTPTEKDNYETAKDKQGTYTKYLSTHIDATDPNAAKISADLAKMPPKERAALCKQMKAANKDPANPTLMLASDPKNPGKVTTQAASKAFIDQKQKSTAAAGVDLSGKTRMRHK